MQNRLLPIEIPAGACPVKLKDTSPEAIVQWAEDVISKGQAIGKQYLPAALRYWVREFYEMFGADYIKVVNFLSEEYGGPIRYTTVPTTATSKEQSRTNSTSNVGKALEELVFETVESHEEDSDIEV